MRAETDIELCSVADLKVKQKIMYALMKAGIPYAEEWEKVSVMKRKRYNGAKEVCIVITHKAKREEAKAVIESLDDEIKKNIIW